MFNTVSNIAIGVALVVVAGVVGYQSSLPDQIRSYWAKGGVHGAQKRIAEDFLNRPSGIPDMKPAFEMDRIEFNAQSLMGPQGGEWQPLPVPSQKRTAPPAPAKRPSPRRTR